MSLVLLIDVDNVDIYKHLYNLYEVILSNKTTPSLT